MGKVLNVCLCKKYGKINLKNLVYHTSLSFVYFFSTARYITPNNPLNTLYSL